MDAPTNELERVEPVNQDVEFCPSNSAPGAMLDHPFPPIASCRVADDTEAAPLASEVINPDFAVVRRDYRIRLAQKQTQLYTRAGQLVASMYRSRGLMTASASCSHQQPEQVTLAASCGHHVFGTLTLGVDTGGGLLADSLYRSQIDQLRNGEKRLCEVTRLALDPALGCPEVMATIFNVAFVLAREVHGRTDLLAEVHPRHAAFYHRTMGYRIVGPERVCPRVGAPAVLMHLCLDFASRQIRQHAGAREGRSLYRLFLPAAQQHDLLQNLTAVRRAAA